MKKFLPFLIGSALIVTTLVLPAEGYAGGSKWILYDDFNSLGINDNLWNVYGNSGYIDTYEGRARFRHPYSDLPYNPAMLLIKVAPDTVKGIKADVTIESCTGDVRARIAGYFGKFEDIDDCYFWNQLGLEGTSGTPRIFGGLEIDWPYPNFTNFYQLFYGQFMKPSLIIGRTFTITMTFSGQKVTYEVDGLGETEYKLPESVSPTAVDFNFKGIGTRSARGGPCVVYFDNVYVLR